MDLKESRVCALVRHAHKDGYSIYIDTALIAVKTWKFILAMQIKEVPPKILGMLVEHIGSLSVAECMQVRQGQPNQIIMREAAKPDMDLIGTETPHGTIEVPLIYKDRFRLFQQEGNLRIVGFDADLLDMADDPHATPFLSEDGKIGAIEDECGRWKLCMGAMSRQAAPVLELLEGFDFNIPEIQEERE